MAEPPSVGFTGAGAFDPDREGPAAPVEGAVSEKLLIYRRWIRPRFTPWSPVSIVQGYVFDSDQGSMVLVPRAINSAVRCAFGVGQP